VRCVRLDTVGTQATSLPFSMFYLLLRLKVLEQVGDVVNNLVETASFDSTSNFLFLKSTEPAFCCATCPTIRVAVGRARTCDHVA
jgi:hypothetical protein